MLQKSASSASWIRKLAETNNTAESANASLRHTVIPYVNVSVKPRDFSPRNGASLITVFRLKLVRVSETIANGVRLFVEIKR